MDEKEKGIPIDFPQQLKGGVYANNMVVQHTKEEFILDFVVVAPPSGAITARVIVSPGHMKRMIRALEVNVSKYEGAYGQIRPAEEPKGTIGFEPNE